MSTAASIWTRTWSWCARWTSCWSTDVYKRQVNGQSRVVHLTAGDYAVLVSDGLLVDGAGWVAKQVELSAAAGAENGLESALRTELLAHTATGCVYVYDPEMCIRDRPGSAGRRRRLMLTINVAPDGSGQFTTISEAVLAVPYDCPAVKMCIRDRSSDTARSPPA